MKSLRTLNTLLLLLAASASFANTGLTDGGKSGKNLSVPTASHIYTSNDAEIPAELEMVKAKSALVPVPKFEFDDIINAPEGLDIPAEVNFVPVSPILIDQNVEAPLELANLKAKSAGVPVAPFIWGNPELQPDLK